MEKHLKLFLLFLISVIHSPSFGQLKTDYIANEGIMLSNQKYKICIDCFFEDGRNGLYETPSCSEQKDMAYANGKYSDVTHLLVTHKHLDHFSYSITNQHLESNGVAKVISSPQVINQLSQKFDNRLIEYLPKIKKEWKTYNEDNLTISMAWMEHPHTKNKDVQNLVYKIIVDGFKYLHIGDASSITENFVHLGLESSTLL